MALPVPDGRLGLLDDVHDPAAELRIEVQVVDVRPKIGKRAIISVTRVGDFLHFGQLFKAFCNNEFAQISYILRQLL